MPSLYLKFWDTLPSGRSSTKRISRPLLRNAITCRRSITVWARNSTSSKMEASGQNVMVEPVLPRGAFPVTSSLPTGLPPSLNSRTWWSPSAVDLQEQSGGERVDHRDTHPVEPTRHLVAAAVAEFAAGVQHGQDHFGGRLAPLSLHRAGGEAPAVVGHPHAAVGQEGHVDLGAVAGHGLVDGVVDDLPHQVVETRRARGTDVHPGSFADRIQTLQDGDVARVVGGFPLGSFLLRLQRHRRALSQCPSGWEPVYRRTPGCADRTFGPSDLPRFQCSSVAARCIASGRWSCVRAALAQR